MIIYRMFFRKDTKQLIYFYSVNQGIVSTIEQDIKALKCLNVFNIESLIVKEISDKEKDLLKNINKCNDILLNEQNELEFKFTEEQIKEFKREKTLEEKCEDLQKQLLSLQNYIVNQQFNNLKEKGGI